MEKTRGSKSQSGSPLRLACWELPSTAWQCKQHGARVWLRTTSGWSYASVPAELFSKAYVATVLRLFFDTKLVPLEACIEPIGTSWAQRVDFTSHCAAFAASSVTR